MSLLPRLRLALARRPWLYWSAVGLLAGAAWLGAAAAQARATAARDEWGTTRRVWVAAAPIAVGEPVRATARDFPLAMVPATAAATVPDGVVAARAIGTGEVLVAIDFAGNGPVPADWLVFAVPGDGPALAAGDRVVVFGSGQLWCAGVVAGGVADSLVEVGVPPDCAAPMSAQLALGAVTLARAP